MSCTKQATITDSTSSSRRKRLIVQELMNMYATCVTDQAWHQLWKALSA
jgi:hypothetical protein